MISIFKEGNVYVLVKGHDYNDYKTARNDPQFVSDQATEASLYGGRVRVRWEKVINRHMPKIYIDGNYIAIPVKETEHKLTYTLEPEQCVAFLNQIENLGVDSFLENYKKNMRELSSKLEKEAQDIKETLLVKEDSQLRIKLNRILLLLSEMTCVIFMFSINLNAGIDNITYTDVYNNILSQFF